MCGTCSECGKSKSKQSKLIHRSKFGLRYNSSVEYTYNESLAATTLGVTALAGINAANNVRLGQNPNGAINARLYIHSVYVTVAGSGGVGAAGAYASGIVGFGTADTYYPLLSYAGNAFNGVSAQLVTDIILPIPVEVGKTIGTFIVDRNTINLDGFANIAHRVRANYAIVYEATED